MDFHSLSRKELQALCKKNKIPANITNVAMADALAALQHVEGLDGILKPVQTEDQQFPEEKVAGTPRTTCRTSLRRKIVREEPESSKVSTRFRNGTRSGTSESIDQEIEDLSVKEKNGVQEKPTDVPKTPAAPSSRVRAAARSTCKKLATSGGTALQRGYSTRRSIRLLEKNLDEMSLIDNENTGPAKMDEISEGLSDISQQTGGSVETDEISEELSDISQQTGGPVEMEKGVGSNKISDVDSEKCDALEVSTEEKNTNYECQSWDSNEEMQLDSEVATDAVPNLQVEPQKEHLDENSSYRCEANGSHLKWDMSSETETNDEPREVLECCEVEVDLNKSADSGANLQVEPQEEPFDENSSCQCEPRGSNSKHNMSSEAYDEPREADLNKSVDSKEEMQLYSEVATDTGAKLQAVSQEEPFEENSSYKYETRGSNLKQDISSEAHDVSREVLKCCDKLEVDLNNSVEGEVDLNNEFIADESVEVLGCFDELESIDNEVDVIDELIDEVDVNNELIADESGEVLECRGEINEGHGLLYEMGDCLHNNSVENEVDVNNESIDDESKEVLECSDELEVELNNSNEKEDVNNELIADESKEVLECPDEINQVSSPNNDSAKPGELDECNSSNQVQENEHLHVADGNDISYSEILFFVNFENSVSIQACNESFVEGKILVENITIPIPLDASLNYNDASKEEKQKDSSKNLDVKAGPEITLLSPDMGKCKDHAVEEKAVLPGMGKCKDHAVEEKAVFDVTSAFPCVAGEKDDSSPQILVPDQEVSVKSCVTAKEISTPVLESHQPTDEITDQVMEPKSPSINLLTHPLMTVAPSHEQKMNAQFPYPAHSESKETANGNQIDPEMIGIQEGDDKKIHKMKENLNVNELNDKSMRQLRKMLKNLTLDGKTKNSNNDINKEVGKKRTALRALPENQMAAVEGQKDS